MKISNVNSSTSLACHHEIEMNSASLGCVQIVCVFCCFKVDHFPSSTQVAWATFSWVCTGEILGMAYTNVQFVNYSCVLCGL